MGGPFEGRYRNASVLHDVVGDRKRPWQDWNHHVLLRQRGEHRLKPRPCFTRSTVGHHWKFPIKRGKPVKFDGQLVAPREFRARSQSTQLKLTRHAIGFRTPIRVSNKSTTSQHRTVMMRRVSGVGAARSILNALGDGRSSVA